MNEKNNLSEEMYLPLKATFQIMFYHLLYSKNGEKNKMTVLKAFISFFLSSVIGFGCLFHFIVNVYYGKTLEFLEILEAIYVVVSVFILIYVNVVFFVKSSAITEVSKVLRDFSLFGMPKKAPSINRKIDLFVYGYYAYCFVGSLLYPTLSILVSDIPGQCRAIKLKNDAYNVCGGPFNMWFFFEPNEFLRKIMVFIQCFSILFLVTTGATSLSAILATTEHIIIRIDDFCEKVKDVFEGDLKTHTSKFQKVVLYHNHIIWLIKQLNHCYDFILFVHMTISAVIISITGYVAMQEKELLYYIYPAGFFVALFICCLAGQRLLDKSAKITKVLYNTRWFETHLPLQSGLQLMLLRSQKPLTLKSAGYGVMSFITFQVIVKTAFSYLTLMKNVESRGVS